MKTILFPVMLLAILVAVTKEPTGHKCRFKLCPYKGAINYTPDISECGESSDCYEIDQLHFKYPDYDYNQLDSIFTNNFKTI